MNDVNPIILKGWTLPAILESLQAVNSTLPAKARITIDSLQKHRMKHYNFQDGASAVYRRMLEEQATREAFEEGVTSLVTPMSFLP